MEVLTPETAVDDGPARSLDIKYLSKENFESSESYKNKCNQILILTALFVPAGQYDSFGHTALGHDSHPGHDSHGLFESHRITPGHARSRQVTPSHSRSFRTIPDHARSRPVTAGHTESPVPSHVPLSRASCLFVARGGDSAPSGGRRRLDCCRRRRDRRQTRPSPPTQGAGDVTSPMTSPDDVTGCRRSAVSRPGAAASV